MKLFRLFVLAVGIIAPLQVSAYVVKAGDTLSSIARGYDGVSASTICALNRLANCNRIRIGQELEIPKQPSENKKEPSAKRVSVTYSVPTSNTVNSKKDPAQSEEVREWKHVGGDPVLPEWVRKDWRSSEKIALDPRQEAKLRLQGLDSSQIDEVKQFLATRNYLLALRPIGYEWASVAFGSGIWGKTRNATGDSIPVFALPPTSKGYQVDLGLGCGNPLTNKVDVSKPKIRVEPPKKEKEARLACERIGAFWAQITEHGESGTARLACLVQLNKQWKFGPTVGIGGSRFDDHTWVEVQNFFGGGFELRGKDIAGLEAVEFVVMVGNGSAFGHSADKMVEKMKSSGLDLELAVQLRKKFSIDKKTAVTVRLMPFANIPLTGKEADILWKGMVVNRENGRHLVIGTTLRFEMHRAELGFKPELTLGVWRISDIDNPVGWKILLGASTLDNVWRVGAGLQFPGPIWVLEFEWNPAWGWLQLNASTESKALHNGATPTCKALGLKKCSPRNETRVVAEDASQKADNAKSLPHPSVSIGGWGNKTQFPERATAHQLPRDISEQMVAATSVRFGFQQR